MRLTFISDTHGYHDKVKLKGGDILFHSGDISLNGTMSDTLSFFDWFDKQDYAYKCFTTGNHDAFFDSPYRDIIYRDIPTSIIYLENSGVTIENINIWGSPITPSFKNKAFNVERGASISEYWKQIPTDTDILLTHGPAHKTLDVNYLEEHTGCEELTKVFYESKHNIKIHSFGHIHESRGIERKHYNSVSTLHINASSMNHRLTESYPPINVDYKTLKTSFRDGRSF